MKTISLKGEGLVSVVLGLVIGAVFGGYIIGTLLGALDTTSLPDGYNDSIIGIGDKGLTSLTIVALAALVVVIGFIMKSI